MSILSSNKSFILRALIISLLCLLHFECYEEISPYPPCFNLSERLNQANDKDGPIDRYNKIFNKQRHCIEADSILGGEKECQDFYFEALGTKEIRDNFPFEFPGYNLIQWVPFDERLGYCSIDCRSGENCDCITTPDCNGDRLSNSDRKLCVNNSFNEIIKPLQRKIDICPNDEPCTRCLPRCVQDEDCSNGELCRVYGTFQKVDDETMEELEVNKGFCLQQVELI